MGHAEMSLAVGDVTGESRDGQWHSARNRPGWWQHCRAGPEDIIPPLDVAKRGRFR